MRQSRSLLIVLAVVLAAWVASLLTCAGAAAQTTAGQGVIDGQAVVASAGATAALNDLPVSLFTFVDGQRQVPPAVAQTDAQGRARFTNLNTSAHYTYTMFVKFQDAIYGSGVIGFGAGSSTTHAEVKVYESTADARALRVDQHHVVIDLDESAHTLDVLDFYEMTNAGDRTIVGAPNQQASGKRVSFHAPLPPDAVVQTIENRTPNSDIFQANGELLDTVPILPGQADLIFEYRVSYQRSTYALSLRSPYTVTALNVLLAPGISLRSARLVYVDNVQATSRQFQHYSARELPANATIAIELNGLPAPLIPLDMLQWLPLAVVSVALLIALFMAYRRKPSDAAPRGQTLA